MPVRVAVILNRKGADVVTVPPSATLSAAAELLAEHDIGALVVSADGRTVSGIVSERDVVRQLARAGAQRLQSRVDEVMTANVTTCDRDATVDQLMATMTQQRVRHVPVVEHGALVGIISIGDVVKSRLDELELQAQALEQYVSGAR